MYIATPTRGARTYSGSKPLVVSEYGHWEYNQGADSDVTRGKINEWGNYGEADMLLQIANHMDGYHQNLGMSNLCGDGLWVGIDYGPYPSGVLDIYRLPKSSYYFWKSQRDPDVSIPGVDGGPMVYIANYWRSASPLPVTVYSNCQQVRLYKNDVLQATRTPDVGSRVPHPPFTFTGLTYDAGTLRAEGLIDGQVVATHNVRTPGSANRLSVAFDTTDVPADGSETIFVYVSILDSNGTLVPTADNTYVTLSVSGPAQLACLASIRSEAGIAAGMIRLTDTPGLITVTATAAGLTGASASFSSY
jgi:beta-galactosidase